MKYAQRYGKKDGYNRADLLKIIHYAFFIYIITIYLRRLKMKISNETKAILKNFATINSGIKVDSGNQLKTISNMKNILAVANVPETFDREFSIYNLVEFLGATSLIENPDYNFNDASLSIADSDTSLTYFYASEGMVMSPEKMITMPEAEITIDLSSTLLNELQKAASVLGVNDLVLLLMARRLNFKSLIKRTQLQIHSLEL